jgi:hypothetical protein
MDESDPPFEPSDGTDAADDGDAPRVTVNVVVSGDLHDTIERLGAAGLIVRQQLDLLGIVTGDVRPDAIDRLREVEGVSSVEPDRQVDAW